MLYVVLRGRCLLTVEGSSSSQVLTEGDVALVSSETGHRLQDRSGSPTRLFNDILPPQQALLGTSRVPCEELLFGFLEMGKRWGSPLGPPLLPAVCVQSSRSAQNGLAEMVNLVERITRENSLGQHAILCRVVQLITIILLREQVSRHRRDEVIALLDPEIGLALQAIHEMPEKDWTVQGLARWAHMSRSVFALRFREVVGIPPRAYLTECRMKRACDLLKHPGISVKEIAHRVGYASVSAFSTAFKRWHGAAPVEFRAGAKAGTPRTAHQAVCTARVDCASQR